MKLWQLTKFERIYIVLFIGSLIAGIIYGTVDREYFKCCEDSIGVPDEGTSVLKIFSNNFLISLTELVTVGMSSLYYNFHTFSITSSYLISQNALYTLPIILLVGFLELLGSLLMALTGLSFLERKLFKIKSSLDSKILFLYGVALIFAGAAVEYLLLLPIM